MKKILAFSILSLAVIGGTASADHRRGRGNGRRHHEWRTSVQIAPVRVVVQRPRVRVVRRPIYVQRPVISVRYVEYDRRPACLHESYPAMTGYAWVAGQWQWNGYEWTWQAGHYEPDPNYNDYEQSYESGYQSTSYDPY